MKLISALFSNIYNKKRSLLISIFFISLLASSMFLLFFGGIGPVQHRIPGADYLSNYEPVANSILQGNGIPVKESFAIKEPLRYPPGYPIILSMIFGLSQLLGISKLGLVVIFNIIMTAGAACFLFLFAESIFNKKIALIASFLWLSYPFNLWFIKNPNTEVPFILLFFLALWVYILGIKRRSFKLFLISGILIGFMSLIRPISIFLPILLAILIFFLIRKPFLRQKTLFSFILIVAYLVVISPWIIYVYLNTGEIIPLSTGGAPSISGGLRMDNNVKEDSLIILPDDVIGLIDRSKTAKMDNFLNVSIFFAREIINQPTAFLKLIAIKTTRAWYATSEMWWEGRILLVQLLYLVPGLMGIIYAFKAYKNRTREIIFLLSIVFYFWVMTIIVLSLLRYMVPAMGIIIIFSAIALNAAMAKWIKIHQNES